MTRREPTDIDRAELTFTCWRCGADPGEWCTTRRGLPAIWLHASRWQQVRQVVELSGWQAWLGDEQSRGREWRRQANALRGGLVAVQGELEQVVDRFPGQFVAPGPLIERLKQILAAGLEQSDA